MTIRTFRAKIYFFLERLQRIDREMAGGGDRNPGGKDRRLVRGLKFSARRDSVNEKKRNKTNRARDQTLAASGKPNRVDSRDC